MALTDKEKEFYENFLELLKKEGIDKEHSIEQCGIAPYCSFFFKNH